MTENELRAVTVGLLVEHNDCIALHEYDPQWPLQFEQEAEQVRRALGAGALQIEHVGSTSVPGLVAKPVIDMLLQVADSSDEADYVPALESAGYVLRIREPEWHRHRLFKGPRGNVNLHVFSPGCTEVQRMLAFRDRLRTSASDRDAYARAKRELAAKTWKYVQGYADAKSAVISQIIARAGVVDSAG